MSVGGTPEGAIPRPPWSIACNLRRRPAPGRRRANDEQRPRARSAGMCPHLPRVRSAGRGDDQGRHPPLAVGNDGDQRDVAQGRRADDHRGDQREGRRARAQARAGRRRPGLELAAVRREGARPDPEGEGRRHLRLLDLGLAQVGAAGVRGAERPALLPGAVRGRGVVLERLLHGRGAQPAGDPRGRVPDGQEGRRRQALRPARHRLRLPAHDQQDPALLPALEGRRRRRHHGEVHALRPQRLPDHRRRRSRSSRAGKRTAVISTINGDSNVPFYKELGNQGIKATDIPVVAFSVGEEELRGIDTKPLVGQLAAWNYFESMDNPRTRRSSTSGWPT